VSNELAEHQASMLQLQAGGRGSLRHPPQFSFAPADAAPGLVESSGSLQQSAYLDSPFAFAVQGAALRPSLAILRVRYCIVRHVGFLIGEGRPAGDAEAGRETVEQVIECCGGRSRGSSAREHSRAPRACVAWRSDAGASH
jgi:hypothetical protein